MESERTEPCRISRRKAFPALAAIPLVAQQAMRTTLAPAAEPDTPQKRESADNALLDRFLRKGIRYFLENQNRQGLVRDRQNNWGSPESEENAIYSISGTGMGMIVYGVAAQIGLLKKREAAERCNRMLAAAETLPQDHGMFPHFVRQKNDVFVPTGHDTFSTVDTSWLLAGAAYASQALESQSIRDRAAMLLENADWRHWTAADESPEVTVHSSLICHGKDDAGRFLGNRVQGKWIPTTWDRLNSETSMMYVLAAGNGDGKNIDPHAWNQLKLCTVHVGDRPVPSGDLGLFANQYGTLVIGATNPGPVNLDATAREAAIANRKASKELGKIHPTFRRIWGLSAGMGPPNAWQEGEEQEEYRIYSPLETDGTAHPQATVASVQHVRDLVLENMQNAIRMESEGTYGLSTVNRDWRSQTVVAIDIAPAVLAIANLRHGNIVRETFSSHAHVRRGLSRLGFTEAEDRGNRAWTHRASS
ncbi:MAG: glucoamylase family protein [Candidatus Peribacteraceae bacterium]|nr:glucoamylase family protein [Candidatus Peribacteraceae bacterium]